MTALSQIPFCQGPLFIAALNGRFDQNSEMVGKIASRIVAVCLNPVLIKVSLVTAAIHIAQFSYYKSQAKQNHPQKDRLLEKSWEQRRCAAMALYNIPLLIIGIFNPQSIEDYNNCNPYRPHVPLWATIKSESLQLVI